MPITSAIASTTNVIGCGNLLRGDDGVGIRVIEELGKEDLPPGVSLIDAGTRSLDLFAFLDGARKAIVVDAVKNGATPGTLYRAETRSAPIAHAGAECISLHDFDWEQALGIGKALLGDAFPEAIVFFGVEVEHTEPGLGLSPPIERALHEIVRMVRSELAVGVALTGPAR